MAKAFPKDRQTNGTRAREIVRDGERAQASAESAKTCLPRGHSVTKQKVVGYGVGNHMPRWRGGKHGSRRSEGFATGREKRARYFHYRAGARSTWAAWALAASGPPCPRVLAIPCRTIGKPGEVCLLHPELATLYRRQQSLQSIARHTCPRRLHSSSFSQRFLIP